MVENVKRLPPHLDKFPLTHDESLEHAQINVLRTRRVQNASSGIAGGEGDKAILIVRALRAADAAGRMDEGIRVVPWIVNPAPARAGDFFARSDAVGPE